MNKKGSASLHIILILNILTILILFILGVSKIIKEKENPKIEYIVEINNPAPKNLRIMTWNCKNYTDEGRYIEKENNKYKRHWPKPFKEREAIAKTILEINPDIIALQEIGGEAWIKQLQRDLKILKSEYPYFAFAKAIDPRRKIAILSKIKLNIQKSSDVNGFLSRGFLSVSVITASNDEVFLYPVHLKSKLQRLAYDFEAKEQRYNEARFLKRLVEYNSQNPNAKLKTPSHFIILGDFNDTPNSDTIKLFSENKFAIMLPENCIKDNTFTYYNNKKEIQSQLDYIFLSRNMYKLLKKDSVTIYKSENAKIASDHFPIYADFTFNINEKDDSKH